MRQSRIAGERGGRRVEIERSVWRSGWRWLGAEQTTRWWFEGSIAGWKFRGDAPVTEAFESEAAAIAWLHELQLPVPELASAWS